MRVGTCKLVKHKKTSIYQFYLFFAVIVGLPLHGPMRNEQRARVHVRVRVRVRVPRCSLSKRMCALARLSVGECRP